MSKRFSILAAALVASGHSLSTIFMDRSDRVLELQTNGIDDLSIEERSRLAFSDPEEPARPNRSQAHISSYSSWL